MIADGRLVARENDPSTAAQAFPEALLGRTQASAPANSSSRSDRRGVAKAED